MYAIRSYYGPETPANALPRQLGARHAAAGAHEVGVDAFQMLQDAGRRYDHTANAAVPDQQVAADTQPEDRDLRVEFAEEDLLV